MRQYEATIVTDRALVDAAKLNLVYTRIVAPTDGRIGLRLVDQGNYVTMGDATGICVITLMQPMSVLFTIPEDTLPSVRRRLKDGATLQVTALDRAQKVELGVGKLSTTDNQMDTTTGTVKLRSMFDNTDEALFPQPVRQCPSAGRHGEGRTRGPGRGCPARASRAPSSTA